MHIIHRVYLSVQFVRVTGTTDPAEIYQIMTKKWGLAPQHLVVGLVGGDEVSQMKPWLKDTVRKGLVKAAQSTGIKCFPLKYKNVKKICILTSDP